MFGPLTGAQRQARYRKRRKADPHKEVADALSAFCDAIEVVTPEQVTEALSDLELLGSAPHLPGASGCLQCSNWDSAGTRRAAVPHKCLILQHGLDRERPTQEP